MNQLKYLRKVIRITAEDSPNVRYAKAQIASGIEATDEIIIPGVLPYSDYLHRRLTWDDIRQSIGLDALFYKGAMLFLYPLQWLDRAENKARELMGLKRIAKSIGIDSGQGTANTAWTIIDELGVIEQISQRTPDTSDITRLTKRYGKLFDVDPRYWVFDAGGGGTMHADRLRREGYPVPPAIEFGGGAKGPMKKKKSLKEKKHESEHKYEFVNRRAEMYWLLREEIDPSLGGNFAIPGHLHELRKQLSKMPLMYDGEGRIMRLPKYRKSTQVEVQKTLTDLLGCSPDEADSLVLALYGLKGRKPRGKVGAIRIGRG
jgi:hypothetical protein